MGGWGAEEFALGSGKKAHIAEEISSRTASGAIKSVICGGNFAINEVAGPQFADANEEPAI